MSDDRGRHAAEPDGDPIESGRSVAGPATSRDAPAQDVPPATDSPAVLSPDVVSPDVVSPDDAVFARPPDTSGGFAARPEPAAYRPPPPTRAPAQPAPQPDADEFARPADGAPFAPQPGERIGARHANRPAVPNVLARAFGAGPSASDGFAPEAGTRLNPGGRAPESPWWQRGAERDPWRDPSTPFWLGRGAIFYRGRPAQLDPALDTALDDPAASAAPGEGEDEERDTGRDDGRRLRLGWPALVVAIVALLVAGAVGGGIGWFATRQTAEALHRPDITIPKVEDPASRSPDSVAGIARRVGPSVVSIAVRTQAGYGIGSGVVIDADGDVLTNNHVIAPAAGDSSASIVVTFSNEDTAQARIVGRDATSDLAVIKVPDDQLTVARLGDSGKLQVGDPVIAIGSPLGLQGTVTSGIVSALDRPVHVFSDDGTSDAYLDAIQTDAPINPGNSGGALVDGGGAVVGINSAAALGTTAPDGSQTQTSGIGYAIPIDYARSIALDLIHTGRARHGSLGAQGRTVVSGLHVGGYLVQVSPGGPAARAGLQTGDVIVAADGQAIQTFDQLVVLVQQHKPGDHLSVTYYPRNSATTRTATVTLG